MMHQNFDLLEASDFSNLHYGLVYHLEIRVVDEASVFLGLMPFMFPRGRIIDCVRRGGGPLGGIFKGPRCIPVIPGLGGGPGRPSEMFVLLLPPIILALMLPDRRKHDYYSELCLASQWC